MYKKNFKIGIFWEQFEWGGVDSHIKYLLNDWEKNEDQFIIYHNNKNKGAIRLKNETKRKNISFEEFNSLFNSKKNYFNFLLIPIKFFISIFKYKKILKKDKLDFIIWENGGYPAAYGVCAALISSYKIKVPVRILVIHHAATKSRIVMRLFRYFLDKSLSYAASSIICVSKATMNSLREHTLLLNNKNNTSKVIYNCVPELDNFPSKNIFNKKIGEKLIGILGRIEPYKGHEDLIEAFSKLPTEIKNKNKIIIIGTGEEKNLKKLKTIIKKFDLNENVLFTGYLDDSIENIIKGLDLVVMPTRNFEGFGYTIAESMSAGVPVLASKVGAVPEVMSLNEGGLFEPSDIEDLCKNLIDFDKNYSMWKKRAEEAKININNKFNSKKIAKKFRDHLVNKFIKDI